MRTIPEDLTLTHAERLNVARANRRQRVRDAVAVAHQGIGDIDATLDELEIDAAWDALDAATWSAVPLDRLGGVEGEFDSGIAGQDLDLAVMG